MAGPIESLLHKQAMGLTAALVQFPSDPSVVNVSHTIKTVSFGPTFPRQINPLNGGCEVTNVSSANNSSWDD